MALARFRERSPVLGALAIQAVVFGVLYLLRPFAEQAMGMPVPLLWVMLAQGVLAGIVSRGFRFSLPWVVGQVIAPPLLVFALALDLPGWVFPVILLLLVLVFWNVAGNRVPLYLTNRRTSDALLKLLPRGKPVHFVDLGSGLGGTLHYLAKAAPDSRFTGLETAPLPLARLYDKARAEMKPGSLFISNSFAVPDQKPHRVVTVKDGRRTKLLIWKM